MGRHAKVLTDSALNLDVRAYGYYSTPGFVADFISAVMLEIDPQGERVLDPAVGKEELLQNFFASGKNVDAFDIHRYKDAYISNFRRQNFLDFYMQWKIAQGAGDCHSAPYDYYIMNPPYNCHEVDYIRGNKRQLQMHFADVGVLNMYSLFLAAAIDMAKDGALIAAIVSDSFMHNALHSGLRRKILQNCSVHYLLLCPGDLFWRQKADIRTAIVVLQKGGRHQKKVRCLQRPGGVAEFQRSLAERRFTEYNRDDLILDAAGQTSTFIVDVAPSVREIFRAAPPVGSMYPCLTGISTGNDHKYLSRSADPHYCVPFYKNPAGRKFHAAADGYLPQNFLELAALSKTFIVRNKQHLFLEAISCSSMGVDFSAAYRPAGTTFGVNANIFPGAENIWWLMAYLNSTLVLYMVRAVIIRSNMITSGYVSRIPLVSLTPQTRAVLAELARAAYDEAAAGRGVEHHLSQIDALVFAACNLPEADEAKIREFRQNLLKRV